MTINIFIVWKKRSLLGYGRRIFALKRLWATEKAVLPLSEMNDADPRRVWKRIKKESKRLSTPPEFRRKRYVAWISKFFQFLTNLLSIALPCSRRFFYLILMWCFFFLFRIYSFGNNWFFMRKIQKTAIERTKIPTEILKDGNFNRFCIGCTVIFQ